MEEGAEETERTVSYVQGSCDGSGAHQLTDAAGPRDRKYLVEFRAKQTSR